MTSTGQRVKIKSFTDLDAWKEGHQLVLAVYKETKRFPEDERFGLTSQVRRAAVSITSNVAEGFARAGKKDKEKFYNTALGSLAETQNQLLIAHDLGYIRKEVFYDLAERSVTVAKLLNGLAKSATEK